MQQRPGRELNRHQRELNSVANHDTQFWYWYCCLTSLNTAEIIRDNVTD